MTCQHCQTWILDDDHRCRHCGRRVRSTPSRISPSTYPIAATATAPAYDFSAESETQAEDVAVSEIAQQCLFRKDLVDSRVIPFDSLTSPIERQSIRARMAGLTRPAPVKTEKVEFRPSRLAKRKADQRRFDFQGNEETLSTPQSHIICDAIVAPALLRLEAACIDGALMAAGCVLAAAVFALAGGSVILDRYTILFLLMGLATVPIFYKILWAIAGVDSIGMQKAGLQLIDFDGNPPTPAHRYQRLAGGILSLLAGGIGLVWSLVDEDHLTWHDHISGTFPTVIIE